MASFKGYKNRGEQATPLAEVFSIIINTGNAEEFQVYGTIEVNDSYGTLLIYDVKQEDPETIHPNGSLCLTNDERAISGYDKFTVRFNLMHKNGEVFINNSFVWDEGMGYDQFLSADILGEHAPVKATMYYNVYELAMEANIWVQFIEDDSESSGSESSDILEVRGSITARFKERFDWPKTEIQKEFHEVTMFESESVELEEQYLVKLSRSVIAVSLVHSLIIAVDLKCSDSDEQLWNDEVEFDPYCIILNQSRAEIKGKYGVLAVYALGFRYLESLKHVNGWKECLMP